MKREIIIAAIILLVLIVMILIACCAVIYAEHLVEDVNHTIKYTRVPQEEM